MHKLPAQLFALLLALVLPLAAQAKKEKPLKSTPGGADLKASCHRLADELCETAKRCDPDKSRRRCRIVKARCDEVKKGTSKSATEDDVGLCVEAIDGITCKVASFDNAYGVKVDFTKLQACGQVAQDPDLLPPPKDEADKGAKDEKAAKDDKGGKDKDKGDDKQDEKPSKNNESEE